MVVSTVPGQPDHLQRFVSWFIVGLGYTSSGTSIFSRSHNHLSCQSF